mmetsp:Transcript_9032/g.29900  ORF Transcript_9032/g.29900 Transcript_9032/m.29900 type:complete len:231 (-) Transcript_9032:31-723(-)
MWGTAAGEGSNAQHGRQQPPAVALVDVHVQQGLVLEAEGLDARGEVVVPVYLDDVLLVPRPNPLRVVQDHHSRVSPEHDVEVLGPLGGAVGAADDAAVEELACGIEDGRHLGGVPALPHGVDVHLKELGGPAEELVGEGAQLGPHPDVREVEELLRARGLGPSPHLPREPLHQLLPGLLRDVDDLAGVEHGVVEVQDEEQLLGGEEALHVDCPDSVRLVLVELHAAGDVP